MLFGKCYWQVIVIRRSGLLVEYQWSVLCSKSQRILCLISPGQILICVYTICRIKVQLFAPFLEDHFLYSVVVDLLLDYFAASTYWSFQLISLSLSLYLSLPLSLSLSLPILLLLLLLLLLSLFHYNNNWWFSLESKWQQVSSTFQDSSK